MSARRRRFPWWVLAVAFVVVPVVEIWTIVQVGQVVGPWWTILLLLAAGAIGSWLVKREGGRAWRAFQEALSQGRMPHREIADGVLILVGGVLYTAGAVVYGLKRPNPFPGAFGFHEIFHTCTVLAFLCHWTASLLAVLNPVA